MNVTERPPDPAPTSAPAGPLQVVITGLSSPDAARLHALLASFYRRVVAFVVPVTDLAATAAASTDIILIGTGAVPTSGDATLTRVLRSESSGPVVIVSDHDDDAAMLTALARGAAGYLLTSVVGDVLVDALEQVARGRTVIDMAMGGRMASRIAGGSQPLPPDLDRWSLRPRERQVLEGLLDGLTNREIARELNIGEETVKTYLRAVYRTLGARDRAQAVAISHGQRSSRHHHQPSESGSP